VVARNPPHPLDTESEVAHMNRLVAAVAALCTLLPSAGASVTRSGAPARPPEWRELLPPAPAPKAEDDAPGPQLTADTEVVLDGRKCEYRDVPATATIVAIAFARDGRTVLRVEFRSRK